MHCSRCPEPALVLSVGLIFLYFLAGLCGGSLPQDGNSIWALGLWQKIRSSPLPLENWPHSWCLVWATTPAHPAMLWFSPSVWGELAQFNEAVATFVPVAHVCATGPACASPPLHVGKVKWEKCWAEEVKLLEAEQSSEPSSKRLLPSMSHTLVSLGCVDTGGVTAVGCCTWQRIYRAFQICEYPKASEINPAQGTVFENPASLFAEHFWMTINQKSRAMTGLTQQQPMWSKQGLNLFPVHTIWDLLKQSKLLLKQLLSKTSIKNSLLISRNQQRLEEQVQDPVESLAVCFYLESVILKWNLWCRLVERIL